MISWISFREKNVPPLGAIFGYLRQARNDRRLRQSGAAGSRDWVPLDSYWFARSSQPVPGGPISWSSEGPPPTPYLPPQGLVSGKCVNDGPRGYLSIRTNADPNDKRTDRIGGEVGLLGMFLPGWGMHLADIPEAAGRSGPRRSARSALDPEQLLDAEPERLAPA